MAHMDAYEQRRVIGRGSFGEAVLCIRKSDAKALQEALRLQEMSSAYIVGFFSAFLDGPAWRQKLCIAMEHAAGGDLADYIRQSRLSGTPIDERLYPFWFVQIAMGLDHIHRRRIVHRDLKPSNIFLTPEMVVKIGDFGIARTLEGTFDKARTMAGTRAYMAPEIFQEGEYTQKADMWSLGCVAYEMVTLELPFGNNVARILNERPKKLPIRKRVNCAPLSDMTALLLEKDPDSRPSASELLVRRKDQLRRCVTNGGTGRSQIAQARRQYYKDLLEDFEAIEVTEAATQAAKEAEDRAALQRAAFEKAQRDAACRIM